MNSSFSSTATTACGLRLLDVSKNRFQIVRPPDLHEIHLHVLVALNSGCVNALTECFDELTLADDPFHTVFIAEDDHDASAYGEQSFCDLLQGVIDTDAHVFIVQGEVANRLSHTTVRALAGFCSSFAHSSWDSSWHRISVVLSTTMA